MYQLGCLRSTGIEEVQFQGRCSSISLKTTDLHSTACKDKGPAPLCLYCTKTGPMLLCHNQAIFSTPYLHLLLRLHQTCGLSRTQTECKHCFRVMSALICRRLFADYSQIKRMLGTFIYATECVTLQLACCSTAHHAM